LRHVYRLLINSVAGELMNVIKVFAYYSAMAKEAIGGF
jgi:hypothetical protein